VCGYYADVLNPRAFGARVARVLATVCAGLRVAECTEQLEVLDAVVLAIAVLVLELERDGLVHPHDDPVLCCEVYVFALVALVRPLQVVDQAVLERHVVEAAVLDEDLVGCLLEPAACGEVARVEVEELGAAHALGLLVPEVVLVAALLQEVEPAGAGAHECPEALVVDRVQLRRGAGLDAGGRLADSEMGDGEAQVLDALHAVRPCVSAAVAVVALAHEFGELRALPHALAEDVV